MDDIRNQTICLLLTMGVNKNDVKSIVNYEKFDMLCDLEISKIESNSGGGPDSNAGVDEVSYDPEDRNILNIIWSTYWFFKLMRIYTSQDTIITNIFEFIMSIYLVMDVFIAGLYESKFISNSNYTIEGKSNMLSNALLFTKTRMELPDNYTPEKAFKNLQSIRRLAEDKTRSEKHFTSRLKKVLIDEKHKIDKSVARCNIENTQEKESIEQKLKDKRTRDQNRSILEQMLKKSVRTCKEYGNIRTEEETLIERKENLQESIITSQKTEKDFSKFFEKEFKKLNKGKISFMKQANRTNGSTEIDNFITDYNRMLKNFQNELTIIEMEKETLVKTLQGPIEAMETIIENVEHNNLNPYIFKICIAISKILDIVNYYRRHVKWLKNNIPEGQIFILCVFINLIVTVNDAHRGGKRKSRRKNKNMRRKSRRVRENNN